ncbi:MAG: hypothetical protein QTN59_21200 [Candidatus Electrothrix communis]|nr:MAG: hypothetical protein QTN59_21200 [Candidatus Electrothrix communis]
MDWLIALLLPLSSYPQAAYLKNLLIDRYGFFEVVGEEREMGIWNVWRGNT